MGRPPGTIHDRNKVILASLPKLRSTDNFHSWVEIAKIFGVSRNTVIGLAHRHGWTGACKAAAPKPTSPRQPSPPRRYVPKEHRV